MLHAVRHTGVGAVFHHSASDRPQLECLTRLRFDEVDVLVRNGDEAGHIVEWISPGVVFPLSCLCSSVVAVVSFQRVASPCDRSDCKVEKGCVLGL